MGYRAALHLAEIARQGKLLGDSLVQNMIMAVAVFDDPELEKDAECYIGLRALDNMMRGSYRYNSAL